MFAAILAASVVVLVALTEPEAFANAYVWIFALAAVVTDFAEIHIEPTRQLILNDLFYLVPFAFLPLEQAAALLLIVLVADTVLHPRPLVRALARQSSKAQMRLAGLAGVLLVRFLLTGEAAAAPDDPSAWAIAALVLAGVVGIRTNDYVVFPLTIRVAVGKAFSFRDYARSHGGYDKFILALEPPLAIVAAFAYQQAPLSLVLLVIPYLALWRLTQLRLRVARLEEADRLKSQFLSMASHELRTPLTSIQGFATTLQDHWNRLADPQKLELVKVIEEQGLRLGRLVDDLLTMSRIEAGALHTAPRPMPVKTFVDSTLKRFGSDAVVLRCPDDLEVLADPDHLEQIVINFVSNASKYGAPPIEVAAMPQGNWVELRVCDQGAGVPEEFVPHLFERFSQASEGSRRSSVGTGLGLSIVQALARAQSGEVWYEPNSPRGSIFAVRLPRAGSELQGTRESRPARG